MNAFNRALPDPSLCGHPPAITDSTVAEAAYKWNLFDNRWYRLGGGMPEDNDKDSQDTRIPPPPLASDE